MTPALALKLLEAALLAYDFFERRHAEIAARNAELSRLYMKWAAGEITDNEYRQRLEARLASTFDEMNAAVDSLPMPEGV